MAESSCGVLLKSITGLSGPPLKTSANLHIAVETDINRFCPVLVTASDKKKKKKKKKKRERERERER